MTTTRASRGSATGSTRAARNASERRRPQARPRARSSTCWSSTRVRDRVRRHYHVAAALHQACAAPPVAEHVTGTLRRGNGDHVGTPLASARQSCADAKACGPTARRQRLPSPTAIKVHLRQAIGPMLEIVGDSLRATWQKPLVSGTSVPSVIFRYQSSTSRRVRTVKATWISSSADYSWHRELEQYAWEAGAGTGPVTDNGGMSQREAAHWSSQPRVRVALSCRMDVMTAACRGRTSSTRRTLRAVGSLRTANAALAERYPARASPRRGAGGPPGDGVARGRRRTMRRAELCTISGR